MTDRGRLQNYYEENRFYCRDRSYSRNRSYIRDRSQGYYYKTDYRNVYRNDCKKINHRDLKTRDMIEGLKTIIKTGTARIIIEIVTKTKTDTKMTAMTRLVDLKITYMIRMIHFTQKLKEYIKFCK